MPWIITVSIGISIVISIAIYFLNKLKRRIYKYIPTIIFFLLAIYFFIMLKSSSGWETLGYAIYYLVALFTGIITLIITVAFDVLRKKRTR